MAGNVANLPASSERAGSKQPIHVISVDGGGVASEPNIASWWNRSHAPAANAQATITKASAGAGLRNICRQITVVWGAGASAPSPASVTVALIDGASGGTSYLWGPMTVSVPAVAGAMNGIAINCFKPGSVATAMTLEFSAGLGANTVESVSMDGDTT